MIDKRVYRKLKIEQNEPNYYVLLIMFIKTCFNENVDI